MVELSWAMSRKLKIIEEKFGTDWKEQFPGYSVNKVYNIACNDNRKCIYVRVSEDIKNMLTVLTDAYEINNDQLIENLIRNEYVSLQQSNLDEIEELHKQFSKG